jgi:serine/threonine protein kinase
MKCPDRDALLAYLRGACTPEVAEHVDNCSVCHAALALLNPEPDSLERVLRQTAIQPFFDEEECRRAQAAVERLLAPADLAATTSYPAGPGPIEGSRRVGRYELLEPLGPPSGQGVVWLARESDTGRECAVKVLRPERNTADHLARFRREIEILVERIKDPNIVLAYDWGVEEGECYLVMELLHGQSLSEVQKRHGRVAVEDACEILCQAATALGVVHAVGFVHRDVKLGNLFLTRDGTVKLLDLGLARLLSGAGEEVTVSDILLGTPDAMPPEQIDDPRQVDCRADLYGLGCVAYRLLTGEFPYGVSMPSQPRQRAWALIEAHQSAPLVPVRSRRSEVPAEVAEIVERLLARDPDERFSSAAEVVAAVRPLLSRRSDLRSLLPAEKNPEGMTLQGELDVLVWDRTQQRYRSIREPGVLPLRTGARFYVEARLSRPAYLYAVWINTEGQVQPLYPWGLDGRMPEERLPCDRLLLPLPDPERGEQPWELEGPPGVETVVLVAKNHPRFDPLALLPVGGGRVARALPLSASVDRERASWFPSRQEEGGPATRGVNRTPAAMEDPVAQVHAFLRREFSPHASLVRAVSFANVGTEGGRS